jgi:K+-sensing histidine kinase KdpD
MMPHKKKIRLALAILLPFLACGLQVVIWPFVSPYLWFLFYPAVFFASWLGGRSGELLATILSAVLVNYFFMEPVHSFLAIKPNQQLTLVMFLQMGTTFAITLQHARAALTSWLRAETHFKTLFEDAPIGIAVIDSKTGQFYSVNPRGLDSAPHFLPLWMAP